MSRFRVPLVVTMALLAAGVAWPRVASPPHPGKALFADDVVMRAVADELDRAMEKLVLADLPRPYFIRLTAEDRTSYSMAAAYGGLLQSDERRMRTVNSRVRVGSFELDNTNFGRSFGNAGYLPLDDDYEALRHAVWLVVDEDYKRAVEVLAAKLAYLKDKTVEDRPDDYAPAEAVVAAEPPAELPFDTREWEQRIVRLSAKFKDHPRIQDSKVTLFAGTSTEWIAASEGTRLRTADTGVLIRAAAELQAEDGMVLEDQVQFLAETFEQLPAIDAMLGEVDAMCRKLIARTEAEVLEHYTGPVLFEPVAAGKAVEALLGDRLCARPVPLGSGGRADKSLEKRIGLRVFPRSFQVYDDPTEERFEGTLLAGAYTFDDEATKPKRVRLVENGILKTLVAGRAPTDKIKQTTGHARSARFGDPQAQVGCLYIQDDNGVSAEELKKELLVAAQEEGLDFALRVESIASGGGSLGDPIHVYKVYVEDGREEPIRGLKFLPVQIRAFKRILAAGSKPEVYNSLSGVPSTFITPALLFEELDLSKTEEEFDKPPILEPPALRPRSRPDGSGPVGVKN